MLKFSILTNLCLVEGDPMKKIYVTALFMLSLSLLLMGCSEEKDDLGIEKAQKVEVVSVDNPDSVVTSIDNQKDIDEFVNKLKIDKWTSKELPSDVSKSGNYIMYQNQTIKLNEKNSKELKEIATITTYKDIPYITLRTSKLSFDFKVPKDVAEYLASMEE